MDAYFKNINEIEFEICAAPDSIFIDFLDLDGDAFMNIEYTDNKEYRVNFYKSPEHISIPLNKLEEGIRLLKKHVSDVE